MMTLPLFDRPSSWAAPKEPPNLDSVKLMTIDTETRDPRLLTHGPGFARGESWPVGVSLAVENGAWYFPFGHPEDNCEWNVQRWLQEVLAVQRRYVFCNAMYDVGALSIIDAIPLGEWTDICTIQAIINEQFVPGYSLDAMSRYWLGTGKDETVLNLALRDYGFKDKGGISFLPARFVGEYATTDAVRTYDTYNKQWPHIESDELTGVMELEETILPLIWQMIKRGVNFDWDKAAMRYNQFEKELWSLRDTITNTAKMIIDPNSAKSISRYCYANGIPYNETLKGNPSFKGEWLNEAQDPVLRMLGRVRKLSKMMGFIESWHDYRGRDGRIHPQWLTTMAEDGGTRSGRFASCDPNLQQVPIRDPEFGPLMRDLWLPEPDTLWGKLDVQSQEIRIAVHYAYLAKCTGAAAMVQAYKENPRLDFHRRVATMAGVERDSAKTISLGSLYGMSQKTLAARLGFSYAHAQSVYRQYHDAVPFFSELAGQASDAAISRGYVKTYLGRKRRFMDHAYVHKALNSIVQGTAADQMKTMMLLVRDELGLVPMITVHDELGYSVDSVEQLQEIARIMEHALEFSVPMVVDCSVAKSWNQK